MEKERLLLTRPYQRLQMMRDLALGAETQKALGVKYGCTQGAISLFRKRYADEIEAIRSNLQDEWAGLWAADKRARVAVYQDTIKTLDDQVELAIAGQLIDSKKLRELLGESTDVVQPLGDISDVLAKLLKARDRALHAIAEELGQLPSRVQVMIGGPKTTLTIEGVDVDKI
jgi:hypothetical protein